MDHGPASAVIFWDFCVGGIGSGGRRPIKLKYEPGATVPLPQKYGGVNTTGLPAGSYSATGDCGRSLLCLP